MKKNFFRKFKIDESSFFDRQEIDFSNFKKILQSELEDFQKLNSEFDLFVDKLQEIQQMIQNRYQLEGRNSFDSKIYDIKNQDRFYQEQMGRK